MTHELFVNGKNISNLVGGLSWASNVDSLGMELNFSAASTDAQGLPKQTVSIGDIVVLKGKKGEIMQGIVLDEQIKGRSPRAYIAFDYGFYLNKNEVIIQFNKIPAGEAIKKLLSQFNVKCSVPKIATKISKIYKGEVVSDIIKDILDQVEKETGVKYRMEMRGSELHIVKGSDLIISAKFNMEAIINPSRSRSAVDMKNVILVVSDDEKVTKVLAKAEDAKNKKKFGVMQKVHTVDKKDVAQAKNIANKMLKELNKIVETGEIELIGNDEARAGRILVINEPVTGLVGRYFIKTVNHTSNKGIHMMKLSLEVAS
jgi:hypothetical protein